MADRARRSGLHFYAIASVPLHAKRQQQRGYNQADLQARHVTARTPIPLLPALLRTVHGPPQARSRDSHERRASVRGASTATQRLEEKRILVVDEGPRRRASRLGPDIRKQDLRTATIRSGHGLARYA